MSRRLKPSDRSRTTGSTTQLSNAPGLAPGVQRLLRLLQVIDPVVQKPLNPRHKAGGVASAQSALRTRDKGRYSPILGTEPELDVHSHYVGSDLGGSNFGAAASTFSSTGVGRELLLDSFFL